MSTTNQTPRGPTPAVYRTSPLYDFYEETLYPYINLKQGGVTPYLNAFRRAISSVNPWARQEIPDTNSVGLGPKYGEQPFFADPYPSRVTTDFHFPSHYNPMDNPKFKAPNNTEVHSGIPSFQFNPHPKHCIRQLTSYKTCLIANEDEKSKCQHEANEILAICPAFALRSMTENQKLKLKLEAQSNLKYKSVMVVPEYNQGRSIAELPRRSAEYGERTNLRPDSIWADNRYSNVTQQEIDEAKERVKKRNLAKGYKPDTSVHIPQYDRTYEAPSTKIPMYP